MKRKLTTWCLALLAAISVARAEDILQVEPFEAVPGSTTEDGRYFVVRLDDTQDYWGVQFDLYLPEGMELDDEGGFSPFELSTERFPHSSRGGQITFKHGVDYTQFESRWYRILISPNDVESFITGREGELLKIYYTTSDDLQPGIHPILVRGALFVVTGVYGVEPPNSASYCTVGTSPLKTGRHADLSGLTGLLPSFVVESLGRDMAGNDALCSVDLTGADTLTVPLALPHANVLQMVADTSRYAARLAAAATPNVVACHKTGQATCARLVMDDALPFATPRAFTATETILKGRRLSAGWNTLCLPFALTAGAVEAAFGEGSRVETFTAWRDGALHFAPAPDGVTAHEPCLLHAPADKTEGETQLGNVSVEPVPEGGAASQQDGARFAGNYDGTATAAGLYGVTPDDRIVRGGAEAVLKSFRAAFDLPATAATAALRLVHDGTTDIGAAPATATGTTDVHTIDGRLVKKNVAAGEATQGLRPGIYIINKKKTIIP